jgi:hypothetical protein
LTLKKAAQIFTLFLTITILYIIAVFLTFTPRSGALSSIDVIVFGYTLVGGAIVFCLGYLSVIFLGGKNSVGLVELISKLNGSSHTLEIKEEKQSKSVFNDATLLYIPALIFLTSLALALNIHYLHTTTDISLQIFTNLQNLLALLDIFLKPTSTGSLRYSIEIIPVIIFFVFAGGVVPSIVFPYLRKYRVTSINAAPFHRDILFSILGTLFGITIVLSLVDIIYGLFTGSQPHYYSYVIPTLAGLSLHYSLGVFMGREKAEQMVGNILESGYGKRVFRGKVIIQSSSSKEPKK